MINFRLIRFFQVIFISLALTLPAQAAQPQDVLRIATSTSVATGLQDFLLPRFAETHDMGFEISSVGSGQALRMGRRGQVDVVLVHAPAAEEEFVASGYGVKRVSLMRNYFVVVGPKHDPAKLGAASSMEDVMVRIATGRGKFVSRGDDSGTHKKERAIWSSIGQTPFGAWYHEAGLDMKGVLTLAGEMQAYTLVDTGTWLSLRSDLKLKVYYQSDEVLLQNPYSVIATDPSKQIPGSVRNDLAEAFIKWITSDEGQSLIADIRVDGEQLFHPTAIRSE